MKNLFVIFNHTLTSVQIEDAQKNLDVENIIYPSDELAAIWGAISPDTDSVTNVISPFLTWLQSEATSGDYVLVQGEFGATWLLVTRLLECGLVPIHATSRRVAQEEHLPSGEVKLTHHFKHIRYRKYGN